MAAYCRVYDSHHLQADCQEPDQLWNPMLGNRVCATFYYLTGKCKLNYAACRTALRCLMSAAQA